jgi:phospholipase C
MRIPRRSYVITAALTAVVLSAAGATGALASQGRATTIQDDGGSSTATPIRHLVVIFDENISFDH